MMAMMGVEESRGTLFADQTMTPEVQFSDYFKFFKFLNFKFELQIFLNFF